MGEFVLPASKGRMGTPPNKPSEDQYEFDNAASMLAMDQAHDAQSVLAGISFNERIHRPQTNTEDVVEVLMACGIFIRDRVPSNG